VSGPQHSQRRCAVIGAPGYSGAEVVSILCEHPGAEIVGLFGSEQRGGAGEAAQSLGDIFPRFRGVCELPVQAASIEAIVACEPDAVFLATPHAVSHDLAPQLVKQGMTVFDLSGAFRLSDPALYPAHYGFEHAHTDALASAVYGLPELNRVAIAGASLIAVPGCYPTSAILALAPLARAGAIAPGRTPIVDSVSGVSGAGRKPTMRTLFCEVSMQPYDVLHHRHNPEIDEHAGVPVIFTPHLGPYDRGILSTSHIDLAVGWDANRIAGEYRAAYEDEPFVRLLPSGRWPSVSAVTRTNFCDIAFAVDEQRRHLIVVSAIDNLVKGAAGQAVQCFNIRWGMPETTALKAGLRGAPCA
jgi:N-acetyl-gamma-glutamyl-phosphate reductase